MYISLYRKYRPQTFADMVEQEAAVSVLRNSLKNNKVGHAYLFSGPRGCGKTSAARLLSKALNCANPTEGFEPCGVCVSCKSITGGDHLDVIEIDGASNRRISEIRELKSHIDLKPLSSKNKVYIIDEVHMLTEESFNALLKTLEEPPVNVFFVLATTEPHKVPVTIRSRCQHIPFHRISINGLVNRIALVCQEEDVNFEDEALWEIGRLSDGALRDALSLSEQAIVLGKGTLSLDSVKELTGGGNRAELEKWVVALRKEPAKATLMLNQMLSSGVSSESFTEYLFALFKDLWLYRQWNDEISEVLEISDTGKMYLKEESKNWNIKTLKKACEYCNALLPKTRLGMRKEVFSGILMLQFLELTTNENDHEICTEKNRVTGSVSVSNIVNKETIKVPLKNNEKDNHKTKEEPISQAEPVYPKGDNPKERFRFDINKICDELGNEGLSKILSKLHINDLTLIAALISGEIRINNTADNEVQFDFNSLAQSIISIPYNKEQLYKAIIGKDHDVLKDNKRTSKKPKEEPFDKSEIKQSDNVNRMASSKANNDTEDSSNKQHPPKPERILKLLGAEVLYVQEINEEESDSLNSEGTQDE